MVLVRKIIMCVLPPDLPLCQQPGCIFSWAINKVFNTHQHFSVWEMCGPSCMIPHLTGLGLSVGNDGNMEQKQNQ